MTYPVVIHKDSDSDFGVTVPDLPGCFSAGRTLNDALTNAGEAIATHVEGLLLDGEPIPEPRRIELHLENGNYEDAIWAVVTVDFAQVAGRARRINITIPRASPVAGGRLCQADRRLPVRVDCSRRPGVHHATA